MKAIIVSAMAFLLSAMTLSVNAQDRQRNNEDAQQRRQEMIDKMVKDLELTEEQKARVVEIYEDMDKNMPSRDRNSNEDREAMRQKMEEARKQQEAKMKEILSPEQFKKWEESRNQMRPGQGRRGNGPGGQRAMLDRPDNGRHLAAAPRMRMEPPAARETAPQNRIRTDRQLNLTAEQKSRLEEMRKELSEKFRSEYASQMRDILNADQIAKLDEMKKSSEGRTNGMKRELPGNHRMKEFRGPENSPETRRNIQKNN